MERERERYGSNVVFKFGLFPIGEREFVFFLCVPETKMGPSIWRTIEMRMIEWLLQMGPLLIIIIISG
jgi:hypothetical protein